MPEPVQPYEPSSSEIVAVAARIRDGWTRTQEQQRIVDSRDRSPLRTETKVVRVTSQMAEALNVLRIGRRGV